MLELIQKLKKKTKRSENMTHFFVELKKEPLVLRYLYLLENKKKLQFYTKAEVIFLSSKVSITPRFFFKS